MGVHCQERASSGCHMQRGARDIDLLDGYVGCSGDGVYQVGADIVDIGLQVEEADIGQGDDQGDALVVCALKAGGTDAVEQGGAASR